MNFRHSTSELPQCTQPVVAAHFAHISVKVFSPVHCMHSYGISFFNFPQKPHSKSSVLSSCNEAAAFCGGAVPLAVPGVSSASVLAFLGGGVSDL